jgi:hypothetical protein
VVRWNLTEQRREMRKADAFFVSVPKSGRTWFRTLWAAYWCCRADIAFQLKPKRIPGMPRVVFTHDRWEHRANPSLKRRMLGYQLIPAGPAARKPVVLLVRDPRDVIVSIYFQVTRRPEADQRWTPASLKELIRHPQFGFSTVCATMNGWYDEWRDRPDFTFYRYEDARRNPDTALREWMRFLGLPAPDEAALAHALEFSDFAAMKRREKEGQFKERALSAGDRSDPESFKARRGKIGGFADYMDAEDIAYCNAELARLSPVFGYRA